MVFSLLHFRPHPFDYFSSFSQQVTIITKNNAAKKSAKKGTFCHGSRVVLNVSEVIYMPHMIQVALRHWNNFPLVSNLATLSHHHSPDNFLFVSLPTSCFHFFLCSSSIGKDQTTGTRGGLPAIGLKYVFV